MPLTDALWSELNQLFTVVCQLDERGNIVRASTLLTSRCQLDSSPSQRFSDLFQFKRPTGLDGSYESLKAAIGQLFLGVNEKYEFAVRGQIIDLENHGVDGLCFVGVPWLWWIQGHTADTQLTLVDFPPHDVQMDQMFFMSTQQAMVDDLQILNGELDAAKKNLEKNTRVKQDFLHHVSHEMRTPLNGVISALALVPKDNLPVKTAQLLQLAAHSADRLLEVINFTLESAAAEAGAANEPSEVFDLGVLLATVLDAVRSQALDKGIELLCHGGQGAVSPYRGQARLLRQVLTNLLSNAVKFTEQGAVTLAVEQTHDVRNDCDRLDFSVTDSGVGIPAEAHKSIFDPFTKGVTPGFNASQGTGLGLNIVKRYVSILGGEIAVESTLGQGTCFSFSIVFERAGAGDLPPITGATSVEDNPALQGHILLVDDMPTNLMLNAQLLRTLGLTVDTAESGEEAVALVIASPGLYRLVLMDLDMPGIDGFAASRQILVDSACSAIPIIALTAYTGESERQKSVAAGMVGFIAKPAARSELAKYLAPWLSGGAVVNADDVEDDKAMNQMVEEFDAKVFTTLAQQVGVDVAGKLVDKFLAESARRWENLRGAISATDTPLVSREAHTLGSACLSFGLMSAGNAFRKIEADSIAGRTIALGQLDAIAPDLTVGIQRLEQTLAGLRHA